MKAFIALFITVLIFITGCASFDPPVACPEDAKTCPDGSSLSRVGPDCEFPACPPSQCTADAKVCPDGSVVTRTGANCEFAPCPEQGTKCLPEQRNAQGCYKILKPVCGWNDPEKIQCVTYPCAETYENDCLACANENVAYYTEGACPA